MKKFVKILISIVITGIILIILAGIYKFNFTNDDIYMQTENGEVVPFDDYEKD